MQLDSAIQNRVNAIDWRRLSSDLSETGYALTGPLLTSAECKSLSDLFSYEERFRSHIVMERYRFGKGDYKYFRYPLPETIEALRTATYPHLARIANDWNTQLENNAKPFPLEHQEFLARCHKAGQKQPTPLLLTTKPAATIVFIRICTVRLRFRCSWS
jgi:hypothetical protein